MPEMPMDTKTQLFFSGVRHFAAKGYEGATVRDICKDAGAANLNAVNYYFGGKEGLYQVILDAMFGELGKRWDQVDEAAPPDQSPEKRLKEYIRVYCTLLYAGDDLSREFTTIFLAEMVRPSPFLLDSAQRLVAPETERFLGLLKDLLGPAADELLLRRCLVSTLGPLLYPAMVWPVTNNFFAAPVVEQLDVFVDHAHRFTMAGIREMRRAGSTTTGERHE